jgi:shikimate 5-dehydrogenase
MKEQPMTERYTLGDLENWREATRDVDPPIRLGVFGDPVAHSLSPQMQNAALRGCEINMQYARFHIRANELRSALRFLRELDFIGINLTVPHKIAALRFVDDLDENAKRIGVVNTIKIETQSCSHRPVAGQTKTRTQPENWTAHSAVATAGGNEKLRGFNTDGEGFLRAVRSEFSVDVRDLRVMVLGAGGGTGHAIAWQCALENCERLVLVNRTLEKAMALADRLGPLFAGPRVLGPVARLEAVPWDEAALRAQLAHVDLIVNATPLGMNPSDPAPIPTRLVAPHHMVFDTVYGPSRTSFLRAADEAGARGANGLSMLLHQGALSFSIWFDREAPIDVMRAALL